MQQSRKCNLRDRHALRVGVLRAFGASDSVTYGGATALGTQVRQTSGQIGAGIAAQAGKRASVYATANWQTSLGGAHQRTIMGDAGVHWAW